MYYIASSIVFLTALLAIRGETWNSGATGWNRLTVTGRLVLLLSFCAFSLAIYQEYHRGGLIGENKNEVIALRNIGKNAFKNTYEYFAIPLILLRVAHIESNPDQNPRFNWFNLQQDEFKIYLREF